MSKYCVDIYFSTFANLIVEADNEEDAIEKARNKCRNMSGQERNELEANLLANMGPLKKRDQAKEI